MEAAIKAVLVILVMLGSVYESWSSANRQKEIFYRNRKKQWKRDYRLYRLTLKYLTTAR